MWIAFRLVAALVAFAVRHFQRAKKPAGGVFEEGRMRYTRTHTHKGAIRGFTLGVSLEAPLVFEIARENARDRFFKKVGLSTEIETKDRAFDDLVYIMCDHPMLSALLTRSREGRDAVRALIADGFHRIRFDGQVLWLDKNVPRGPSAEEQRAAHALGQALEPLERDKSRRLSDPFLWRALVVEGVVWSVAGYAIASMISLMGQNEDIHFDQQGLLMRGTLLAIGLFVALAGLSAVLLRGSSRGHRIILESAVVLLFTLPPAGWQAIADVNRALDATQQEIRVPVSRCETRVKRNKRRTSTNYYLHFGVTSVDGVELHGALKTNAAACHSLIPGVAARMVIGRGALEMAWIRSMTVGNYTWSS